MPRSKEPTWNLSKLTYILLSLIGILLIILVILGTCTDTFKSIGIYKLPVLTPQETSRLGTRMNMPVHKGLSNIERGVLPRFRRSYEMPKPPSSEEPSSGESSSEEPGTLEPASSERVPWMPMLTLFKPRHEVPEQKEPSLYSRLKNAGDSGNLK